MPVERLIDGQYGDDPPAGAANAVQAQVSRLRRALPQGLVEFHTGGYRLAVEPDDVDAHRFERLAGEGHRLLVAGRQSEAATLLREGLALWRGPALADLPSGPLRDAAIAALDELRLTATEDLVEAEPALPSGTSVAELGRLVAAHPLRERLRGQLMRALHAAGRQAEALEEYTKARRSLRAELGADPGPALAAVHRTILRAQRPAPPSRRGLPAALTSFVGRADELAQLDGAVARLVTLVGPGGAGKTRLATRWAAATDTPVCFVDLAPLVEPDDVPAAVLGAREHGFGQAGNPVERLVTAVGAQELLLVVDNCEHVLPGIAALARELLSGCPGLRVLATSREPLGLTGETLVPLAPLPVPPPDAPDAAGYPAMRLFAERAAVVHPGFTVDATNVAAVVAICTALDGLPLAIELAAAMVRRLSVDAIAARLAGPDRFRLLTRGDPTAAVRHRSLAAVVEWSWDLLRPEEQQVARRFTVFSGGAGLDAVEAVCGAGSADLLAGLVDRSLVETDGTRYRMLETIRLFCAARLAGSGEADGLRLAHARHHLVLAKEADPHLRRAEQLDWLALLTVEHANLMAALRWAGEHARSEAFELVAALTAYWWFSGRSTEGGEVAAALLKGELPAGLDEEYVACVLHAVPPPGPEHWARAAEIVRTIDHGLTYPFGAAMWDMTTGPPDEDTENRNLLTDDPWNRALMRLSRVLLGIIRGGITDDEREMTLALDAFRGLGDRWGTAQALDWLGLLAGWRGRFADAYAQWAQALHLHGELGALDECASVLFHRGECLLRDGDVAAAEADFREGDELCRRAGRPGTAAEAAWGLAEIASRRGDRSTAAPLLERALGTARAVGEQVDWNTSRLLTALGRLAELDGDVHTARRRHRDALVTARASPLRSDLADAVEGAAGAVLLDGDAVLAADLLGAGVALRGLAVAGDRHVARVADGARAAAGAAAFTDAWRRGSALPAAAALTLVDDVLERLSAD